MKAVLINSVPECRDLPQASPIYDQEQPAHAVGGLTTDGSAILWLGLAFESVSIFVASAFSMARYIDLGPVVQSVVSLTSLLRVISLTVLADSIHNILIFC